MINAPRTTNDVPDPDPTARVTPVGVTARSSWPVGERATRADGWQHLLVAMLKLPFMNSRPWGDGKPTMTVRSRTRRAIKRLTREIAALHQVVAVMRSEMQGAHEREARAHYLAFHDDLTELPNRRYFRERLGLDLQGEAPVLAVIYIDLNGFKALNDTHGHDAGDCLLNLVAARLLHNLRAEDVVSRLGGDEFACLITGVSNGDRLQAIGSMLFKAVSTPFQWGELSITVSPSIGIAVYPSDGTTIDGLMKAADTAMYAAKRIRSSLIISQQTDSTSC